MFMVCLEVGAPMHRVLFANFATAGWSILRVYARKNLPLLSTRDEGGRVVCDDNEDSKATAM